MSSKLTIEEFEALADRVRTWGRWGDHDERGTLNYITQEARVRASACVVDGAAFPLSIPLTWKGPQHAGPIMRFNPIRTMTAINAPSGTYPTSAVYSDDVVTMPIQAATHWDALSHTGYRDVMYNGVPSAAITYAGAQRLGIDAFGAVATRAVLLDLPRHLGVDRLEPRFEVTADLLAECEEAQGCSVQRGDILLLRTGHIQVFLEGDVDGYHAPAPGAGPSCAEYFAAREVAAAATDTIAFELYPSLAPEVGLPLHVLCHTMMGLPLGENWHLEDLAAASASDGRYDVLLEASPEPLESSTGGLVNPVALR
ncbi:cyclase family protein [Streptomyces sp. WG-D5]